MANGASTQKLILVPAVITLAVTVLRLVGELQHWSPRLFNPAAGGGGALVGIAWLVPIFGIYFGYMLARAGEGPASAGKALLCAFLGVAVVPVIGFAAVKLGMSPTSFSLFGVYVVLSVVGAVLAYKGWPALGRTLFVYALAARIPVMVVMLFAILGNWGTHYDVAPPNFPAMSPVAKWLAIGVLPQATVWIWFTMALGALFGALTAAVSGRARRPVTA